MTNLGNDQDSSSTPSSLPKPNDKNIFPNLVCSVKLDRTNYSLWLTHILPIIKGYKLEGYINGTKPCPPQFISKNDQTVLNPEFEDWESADQLLFGWLLNTMTLDVTTEMTNVSTAAGLWNTAKQLAGAQNRSRLLMLRSELQHTRKGEMKMFEYLTKLKSIADQLALAGSPILLPDLIIQALAGLDADYNAVVVQLSNQADTLSWIDLQTTLYTFESRLQQLNQLTNPPVSHNLINMARSNTGSYSRNTWRGGRSRGRRGRTNWNRGNRFNNSDCTDEEKPQCQLCTRFGHTVETCFYRFDRSFVPSSRKGNSGSRKNSGFTNTENDHVYWATPETVADDAWYLDSGATSHVTNDINKLENASDTNGKIKITVGDGYKLEVLKVGNSTIQNVPNKRVKFRNVLFTPEIKKNLLSVFKVAVDNKADVVFNTKGVFVEDQETGETILMGNPSDGGMFRISSNLPSTNVAVWACQATKTIGQNRNADCTSKSIWHCRLGHPNDRILNLLISTCNLKVSNNKTMLFCEACKYGKSHSLPFTLSSSHATKPLELIHTDLWGPAPLTSMNGFRYYILFLDDYSRYSWVYPLKTKDEALPTFLTYKRLVENQFDTKIKTLQSDWGGEYRSFSQILSNAGIHFRHSCPHTSSQNGRAERKHRHIVETGLTLLAEAKMPLFYCWEAFHTATDLINKLPTSILKGDTPHFRLFGKLPDYNNLKVFGAACYPCLRPYNEHKL